jgi:hypothetical protein
MTLKNAALLAFVGTSLLELLLILGLVHDVIAVSEGLVPSLTLLKSLVYAISGFTVALFFFIFQKDRS